MKIMKRAFILFIMISACFVNISCLNLKKMPHRIHYYTLDYEPPRMTNFNPLPSTLKILPFATLKPYNTKRIVFRENPLSLDSYVYYRWISLPGDIVTQRLVRDFSSTGLFRAILSDKNTISSSFFMEGTVEDFLYQGTGKLSEVLLTINLVLFKQKDMKTNIIFQRRYTATTPCNDNHPMEIAEAMSKSMASISGKIIKDTYHAIKKYSE
jgi:ABC-type uncharacterized transport system auxiliary subunit